MTGQPGFLALAGRGLGMMAGTLALAGAVAYSAGTVSVRVQEKKTDGANIRLAVPSLVIPLGMKFVPERELEQMAADLRPWLPAIKIASRELARCADGPLVEVETPREKVRVVNRGGSLVIDVDTDRESVHVSVPLWTVTSVLRQIERHGPAASRKTGRDAQVAEKRLRGSPLP